MLCCHDFLWPYHAHVVRSYLRCTSPALTNRVYLSSTHVAQLEDNESTIDVNEASTISDRVRTTPYTNKAATTPEASGKLAPVPVLVKEDVHDAHQIDSAAPHSVVSNSVIGPQFYTNREGLVSERETLAASGRSWSDEELVLLQKLHLQEASDLELQASFPDRTLPAIFDKITFMRSRSEALATRRPRNACLETGGRLFVRVDQDSMVSKSNSSRLETRE